VSYHLNSHKSQIGNISLQKAGLLASPENRRPISSGSNSSASSCPRSMSFSPTHLAGNRAILSQFESDGHGFRRSITDELLLR
jgi:hypothetical protein